MKLNRFLLLIILFNFVINQTGNVVNSCGKFKNYTAPKTQEDCKDPDEKFCKFVNITKNGTNILFCAVIHGKYNDEEVLEDVRNLINAETIEVLGSKYLIGKSPIFYFVFFYILLFLF